MIHRWLPFYILILSIIYAGCQQDTPVNENRIIIGIPSDIETYNPLYSFSVDEGVISELLYLSLVQPEWDSKKGDLIFKPMLAEKWEWLNDSASIKFYLRNDVKWTDGVSFTANDVVFSFITYSDPAVQSKLYGTFNKFYTDDMNKIDPEKSFSFDSENELIIHLRRSKKANLLDFSVPIIPEHIFKNVPAKDISTSDLLFSNVTSGAFKLKKWERNQFIILRQDSSSFLFNPDAVAELVFKIVPDYTSRLNQLKKGEIDLMELVKPEDADELKKTDHLLIAYQKGREYDYIGWNNIDPESFNEEGIIKPHKLFGDKKVRRALTHAINREEIFNEGLLGYGQLATGPVSPIFANAINTDLPHLDYDPGLSRKLLSEAGWKDSDNNGTIDKNGVEFSFTMIIPPEDPLRNFAATIVKNNLKDAGIELNVETMELGTYIENLYSKSLDSWMAAWYVPIPLDLKNYWYSDPEQTPANLCSYKNIRVDSLLILAETETDENKLNEIYKSVQELIQQDQPVTFLYWKDNIVAYNKRIKNLQVNPFGVVHHCWLWSVN